MTTDDKTSAEQDAARTGAASTRMALVVRVLDLLGSGRLALVLILLLILFSMCGAILPQSSRFLPEEISAWQIRFPIITRVAAPLDLFQAFQSWPFLVTIVLLAVNTLTCTVLHLVREGGFRGLSGEPLVRRVGFVLLHLSLLFLFAAGFLSASADLDGKIILTEGQQFTDAHDGYLRLREGPLRRERHTGATLRLKSVNVHYTREQYRVGVTSELEILEDGEAVSTGTVRINQPLEYQGLSYTYDNNGFSPRLIIREARSGRVLADSFIALQTIRDGKEREYRDFLPLPFLSDKVVVTLFPTFVQEGDVIRKAGDRLTEPMLEITTENDAGIVDERHYLAVGGRVTIGRFAFECPELRQWAAFRAGHDPGYPYACAALWLVVIALLMRYLPDVRSWVRHWSIIPSDAVAAPRDAPVVPPTS